MTDDNYTLWQTEPTHSLRDKLAVARVFGDEEIVRLIQEELANREADEDYRRLMYRDAHDEELDWYPPRVGGSE